MPARDEVFDKGGMVAGSSQHAGVAGRAEQGQNLERLCRYISRAATAEQRLSLTQNGIVRYQLKTPYRDGTIHVIFEPIDFIARLPVLVPKPRVNLTRFHGGLLRASCPPPFGPSLFPIRAGSPSWPHARALPRAHPVGFSSRRNQLV